MNKASRMLTLQMAVSGMAINQSTRLRVAGGAGRPYTAGRYITPVSEELIWPISCRSRSRNARGAASAPRSVRWAW
jgi:hypothetical protein